MSEIRVNIYKNEKIPHSPHKVLVNREKDTFDVFLKKCGTKLGLSKARLAYDHTGAIIDELELLRDDQELYISQGERFLVSGSLTTVAETPEERKENAKKSFFKIALLGDASVGKSAITCRYVFKRFLKSYTSTLEDFYTKRTNIDNEFVELDILDTAGMEEFSVVRDANIKDRDGFLMVFDLTNMDTFDRLAQFYKLIDLIHTNRGVPTVIVGNKVDKEGERKVGTERAMSLAKDKRAQYIECSALNGSGIDEAFASLVRSLRKKHDNKSTMQLPGGERCCCNTF